MAFVDDITIYAQAGRGGDGVVRWLHMRGKDKGGPAGGDGGWGGDVVVEGVRDLAALANYKFEKKFLAENGVNGDVNNRHGRNGKDMVLKVPVGTVVKNETTKESFEVLEEGVQTVVFRGGKGGLGNARFKGPTNQNPMDSTTGRTGKSGDIRFTLKIIADVGLVGYPNAGKSSLLNVLTRARSKVGSYPFTTLDPHIGDFYGYLIADIPGLIEGASAGKGLGSKFLKHIERTVLIAHLVSAEQEDVVKAYKSIRTELEKWSPELVGKRELVVLSKVDVLSEEELATKKAELEKVSGKKVHVLSIIDDALVKEFSDMLTDEIAESRKKVAKEASDDEEAAG